MKKLRKIVHRLFRIMILRKGVYCRYGRGCSFKEGVEIDEATQIGDYTHIARYTEITAATIGSYCSIGPFCTIGPGEHVINSYSTSERITDILHPQHSLVEKQVQIGNDVWIGSKAIVLRGVKIGNGAVIGAGAIVTRDVPDYAIVVGVPAKVLRFRDVVSCAQDMGRTNWWKKAPKEASRILQESHLLEGDINGK